MTTKIICAWVGNFTSEEALHQNYLYIDYDNEDEDEPTSKFGTDTGLDFYDEDCMESWWFTKLDIATLTEYENVLPDANYFFADLITQLKSNDLTDKNTITFLFGQLGAHATNEMLFDYNGATKNNAPIQFVFKKVYEK